MKTATKTNDSSALESLDPEPREVICGNTTAFLHLSRMSENKMSSSVCIRHADTWITPNMFQAVSGRKAAKDWKRSIKHNGKSLKILLKSGTMTVEPPACRCEMCIAGGGKKTEDTLTSKEESTHGQEYGEDVCAREEGNVEGENADKNDTILSAKRKRKSKNKSILLPKKRKVVTTIKEPKRYSNLNTTEETSKRSRKQEVEVSENTRVVRRRSKSTTVSPSSAKRQKMGNGETSVTEQSKKQTSAKSKRKRAQERVAVNELEATAASTNNDAKYDPSIGATEKSDPDADNEKKSEGKCLGIIKEASAPEDIDAITDDSQANADDNYLVRKAIEATSVLGDILGEGNVIVKTESATIDPLQSDLKPSESQDAKPGDEKTHSAIRDALMRSPIIVAIVNDDMHSSAPQQIDAGKHVSKNNVIDKSPGELQTKNDESFTVVKEEQPTVTSRSPEVAATTSPSGANRSNKAYVVEVSKTGELSVNQLSVNCEKNVTQEATENHETNGPVVDAKSSVPPEPEPAADISKPSRRKGRLPRSNRETSTLTPKKETRLLDIIRELTTFKLQITEQERKTRPLTPGESAPLLKARLTQRDGPYPSDILVRSLPTARPLGITSLLRQGSANRKPVAAVIGQKCESTAGGGNEKSLQCNISNEFKSPELGVNIKNEFNKPCVLNVPQRKRPNSLPGPSGPPASTPTGPGPRANSRCSMPLYPAGALDLSACSGARAIGHVPGGGRMSDGPVGHRKLPNNVGAWSVDDVFYFIQTTPASAHCAQVFRENYVTGRMLRNLGVTQLINVLHIDQRAAEAVQTRVSGLLAASHGTKTSGSAAPPNRRRGTKTQMGVGYSQLPH